MLFKSSHIIPLQYIFQVNFFVSPNLLENFTEHTKVIRLYPRPIVTIKTKSYMNTRPKDQGNSSFLTTFSTSQVSITWFRMESII